MTIGLIGYGRFGEFVAPLIARRGSVVVYDVRRTHRAQLPPHAKRGRLAEAAGQEAVLLAVPVAELRKVLVRIRPLLHPGSLVVDVCAVKALPIQWMKRHLPPTVGILGTHPLFGPDSGRKGLRGLTVVLCPVRIEGARLATVLTELHRAGIETVFMNPDDHDRMMAETILLSQYVGRLIDETGATRWPPVTQNYAHLCALVNTVCNDTVGLFSDMVRFNAHGKALLRHLERAHRDLRRTVRTRAPR